MQEWYSLYWFFLSTLRNYEWANPDFFYTLLLIPILFLLKWVFGSQKKQKLGLAIENLISETSLSTYLRYLIPLFFVFGMITLIISLARPQLSNASTKKYVEGIDIALGIDISESMLAKDLTPNRLGAAKNIAKKFINGRENDRIALVAFAGETSTLSPLTTDHEMLIQYLNELNTNLIKTSGTSIGLALASCINKLKDVGGKTKICILISDGDNTSGSIDPELALELAKTFGIRIYTIAIGKDNTEEKIDEKTLKMLASDSKGLFFRATENKALDQIFDQINALEKNKFEDEREKNVSDYYYIYLSWSILFFLISFLLKNTFMGNLMED